MRRLLFFVGLLGCFLMLNAQEEEDYEDYGDGGVLKVKDSKKYDLTVELTTGNTVDVSSKLMIDYCNRIMFLYDSAGNPIYPQNTYTVTRIMKDSSELKGYPTDSTWLFQVEGGKISTFATKPEIKMKHVEYITKDESDLIPFSKDTLHYLIKDNSEALNVFKRSESQRKWSNVLTLAGFGALLTHLYVPNGIEVGGFEVPPIPIVGLVIGGSGMYLKGRSKRNFERVVKTYNSK